MKNDKTYKKLEENWKKLEEGMMPPMFAFNAGAQLAASNAGRQLADIENERLNGPALTPEVVSHGISRFVKVYGRNPQPNREDADNVGIFINEVRPNNALFGNKRIELGMNAIKMSQGNV